MTPLGLLESFLDERIAAGDFPGVVFAIDGPSGLLACGARGSRALVPRVEPATLDTLYDLASLTKPVATASLAVLLSRAGDLRPEDRAVRWIPELAGAGKDEITLNHLASHSAGLPAWLPLYAMAGGAESFVGTIASAPLDHSPVHRALYSDCGFILLGEAVARAAGEPLDLSFRHLVSDPLGLATLCFRPSDSLRSRIAPTERDCTTERKMVKQRGLRYDGWRLGVIRGEVHDGNAWALGGVAGHAGLFGTVGDLVLFCRELLGRGQGLFEERERKMFSTVTVLEGEVRSFGWQLAATPGSAAHGELPDEAYGHTGFTGTSMWVDGSEGRVYLLLTNRIHPDNRGTDMNSVRREFHRLARRLG